MAAPDEDLAVRILRRAVGAGGSPGEDVEIFAGRGRGRVAVAVDTLVESTDVPPRMEMSRVSRKAVAACVSDFAAKGVAPEFGVVSVVVPAGMARGRITALARGFRRASREFGVKILGGDTSGGRELVISVSLYGAADRIVPRGGARPGDAIFATGDFGDSAAGLRLLLRQAPPPGGAGQGAAERRYEDAFCVPRPRLEFGIRSRRYVSSAMDSSDGLARTLNEMARQSGSRFVLSRLPHGRALGAFAARNGIPVEELVLFGGEEYETVFTAPRRNAARVRAAAAKSRTKVTEIGAVGPGSGVELLSEGGSATIPDRGWVHLRG